MQQDILIIWKFVISFDYLTYLAAHITKLDPDGITLYLFDNGFKKYENVTSAEQVNEHFSSVRPGGIQKCCYFVSLNNNQFRWYQFSICSQDSIYRTFQHWKG